MKNTKVAQARLVIAALLIVASPFLAYLIPKLFTPIVCDIPKDEYVRYWFPCSREAMYLSVAGLLTPLAIATCLLLWHRRRQPKSKNNSRP